MALGQPAVAVTDSDNLFALVKFYKAAEGAGIKPIAGADMRLADGNEAPDAHDPAVPRPRRLPQPVAPALARLDGRPSHRRRRDPPGLAARATTPACSRSPAATAWPADCAAGNATNWPKRWLARLAARTSAIACTWN